jgi:YesN/AraC family two-component response regulator
MGFSSQYYFSQFFKKHEGYPPKIYRDNINHVG